MRRHPACPAGKQPGTAWQVSCLRLHHECSLSEACPCRVQTQELVHCGCIEYVDTEEEETTMIAMEIRDLC